MTGYLLWKISDYFLGKSQSLLAAAATYNTCPPGSYGAAKCDFYTRAAEVYSALAMAFGKR